MPDFVRTMTTALVGVDAHSKVFVLPIMFDIRPGGYEARHLILPVPRC